MNAKHNSVKLTISNSTNKNKRLKAVFTDRPQG